MGFVFSGSRRLRPLSFLSIGCLLLGTPSLAQTSLPGRTTSTEETGPRSVSVEGRTSVSARAAVSTLTINPIYDDAAMSAAGLSPAQILSVHNAFAAAAAQLTSNFTDPINVNINVTALAGTGTFGSSSVFRVGRTYTEIRNALLADSKTVDDATSLAFGGSVPASDPVVGNHSWFLSTALAKALGLLADDLIADGTFTFGAGNNFSFDPNNVGIGQYDFQGLAMHEISEIMGRFPGLGVLSNQTPSYRPFDLFRFTSVGGRGLTGGGGIQFSMDGGTTLLKLFNNAAANSGDPQDWANGTNDAFNAFSSSGVKNILSSLDLRVMDVIGYDRGTTVQCSYTVGPGSGASVPAAGGSGTINVVTSPGCAWTASTIVPWLSITAGATGSGSGSATFLAQANQSAQRSGNISIAGNTYTITQAAGPACTYTLGPGSGTSVPADGGSGSITVTTSAGCAWTATSDSPAWLTITSGASGSGSGSAQFLASPNSGTPRSGNIAIAAQNYQVSQTGGAPLITSVANASGYQPKVTPGSVFGVFGTNLGPASIVFATAPNYPLALAGTSVTFTPVAGGAVITARIYYSLNIAVAGLLPSTMPLGTYQVRVTFNGLTSAPMIVAVVARSLGIATADSSGSGPAQATNGAVNNGISLVRFTSGTSTFGGFTYILGPAHPGDILVLWGTGGGADLANDTGGSSGDQTAAGNFVVLVGGQQVIPLYAGTSVGYPGLWQVNFKLPLNITPDCFTTVQVSAGGELSNQPTIAIAAAGQDACPNQNLSASQLSKIDTSQDLRIAKVNVTRSIDSVSGNTTESASGSISLFKAAKYVLNFSGPQVDRCLMYDRSYPVGGVDPSSAEALLDAGSQLNLVGPPFQFGPGLPIGQIAGPAYAASAAAGTWMGGANYTITGTGGTQIGPFNASTIFPASFTVPNLTAITSVDRTQPLTLNWTAAGVDQVEFSISTVVVTGPSQRITTLTCSLPSDLGSYAIPAAALALLQPSATGVIKVSGQSTPGTFTAEVVGGGQTDAGDFTSKIEVSKSVVVQ